ncbi:hypothetical protein D7X33_41810, partial [Butyricicoccus sp. 1XD8-22]
SPCCILLFSYIRGLLSIVRFYWGCSRSRIYGEHDRRIIFENSQYKVILQCGDAETQEYISRLIGKYSRFSYGCAQHLDPDLECSGYNVQLNEIQEWMVQPHKLAALNDLLVLSPHGLFRVEKFLPGRESQTSSRFTSADPADWKAHLAIAPLKEARLNEKRNSGAKLLTIKKRTKIAETLVEDALQKLQLAEKQAEEEAQAQWLADRQAQEEKEKRAKYRKYIIGEVIAQYLPEIIGFEPGEKIESGDGIKILDQMLAELGLV